MLLKTVSVILVALLAIGTTLCAGAEELPDLYGITLGTNSTQSGTALQPPTLFGNRVAGDRTFTVTVKKTTSGTALLTWSSEELHMSYTVCRYNLITESWEELLTTADTTAVVRGLQQHQQYHFAVKNGVTGEILGVTEARTKVRAAKVRIADRSSDQVTLAFSRVPEGATVIVLRSTDGKQYQKIGETKKKRFTDKKVKEATVYYYKVKCWITQDGVTEKSKAGAAVQTATLKRFGLPAVSGACKTYAYYTAVTSRRSPQYRLLRSDACYTDPDTGIRMVDGYYCVALGSYYGTKIGTKYKITLDDHGTKRTINVILCDQKANRHTDSNHQYALNNSDIVEFYVEKRCIPRGIRGDYGTMEQFRGNVVAIEQYVDC